MLKFQRYIGIDYSGAQTPVASLKGLRVYESKNVDSAHEVMPTPSARKYWTRKGIAHWLAEQLDMGIPIIVGIDHGFSFPMAYFEYHGLALDWDAFLADFHRHWPTGDEEVTVDDVRRGTVGQGHARSGDARWRRICETKCRAKSVFHFDVQGSVAKSTHSGIAWLWFLRRQFGQRVHVWPFDGWEVPAGKSVLLEAYPALYKTEFARQDRTPDQHDAYSIARWLCQADHDGRLNKALCPTLASEQASAARIEGWILGVS